MVNPPKKSICRGGHTSAPRASRFAIVALVASLVAPSALLAQRNHRPALRTHLGGFDIGVHALQLSQFNAALPASYSKVKDTALMIGGHGMTLMRRGIIGGEGMALISARSNTAGNTYATRLTGGYGMIDVGYAAVRKRKLLVYPLLGVGGGAMQFAITPNAGTTFSDVVNNPARMSTLTTTSMTIALRGGVTYMLRSRRPNGGMALGVRGGYVFTPFRSDWRNGETSTVSGGPALSTKGPEISISIGGWRR